jgi:hypothetical protein
MPGQQASRVARRRSVRRLPTPNVKAALSPHGIQVLVDARVVQRKEAAPRSYFAGWDADPSTGPPRPKEEDEDHCERQRQDEDRVGAQRCGQQHEGEDAERVQEQAQGMPRLGCRHVF